MTSRDHRSGMLDIRPLTAQKVPVLEHALAYGFPAKHAARYELQRQGKAIYFVAWLHDRPVGHVLIEWAGCQVEPMQSALPKCPMASDLLAVEDVRSQGIGSQLLAAMEDQARAAGYTRLGLAVAVDNDRARALYERRAIVTPASHRMSTGGRKPTSTARKPGTRNVTCT